MPVTAELPLPRPPGVLRRFWARHPRLADGLIAGGAFLASIAGVAMPARTIDGSPATPGVAGGVAILVLVALGCAALLWRRRLPVWVFAATLLPVVLLPLPWGAGAVPATFAALIAVAIHRGTRECWIAFGAASVVLVASDLARAGLAGLASPEARTTMPFAANIVFLLVAVLIGVNLGSRKRYIDALIDRSERLLVERRQRDELAASAERARIAREMHDVVSHSLSVVVALAEGAAATDDAARAREAMRAAARTARESLGDMRGMLGVLHDGSAPLAPVIGRETIDAVVADARAAGLPVTLARTGSEPGSPATRLAVQRIVQEGVTNALRYARDPSYVRVAIAHGEQGTTVAVENDGSPRDAPSVGAGSGLRGLRERVAHVGGSLEAGLVAEGVWRVTAELPAEGADES